MLLHLLLLLPISYFIFVFTSNLSNPFVNAKAPLKRRKWHLGRAAAFSSLAAGTIAVLIMHFYQLNDRFGLMLYLCVGTMFVAPSIAKYRRTSLWK